MQFCLQIKQDPVSESEDERTSSTNNTEVTSSKASEAKLGRPSRNADKTKTNRARNKSAESLYKDAVSQPSNSSSAVSVVT